MSTNTMIQDVAKIVGAKRVYDDPTTLEAYSKDHSFVPPRKPLAVVKPKNTDQIKEIIDWANKTLVPLIPTSSGFPKFHGDTISTVPGIVVDLSELDQVLRVDQRNKIAIIEPGVTFGKLREALVDQGMVPYTPLLPRSTKSLLASALEREPITVPKDHWDFNDPIAGGEVVIGDGHIQGFGDSAGHTKEEVARGEAIPVIPLGPSCIGWLNMIQGAQGTLGIVRWVSVRCRLKPSIQKPFLIAAQDLKDILPFLQRMMKFRIAEEVFILNDFGLTTILSEEDQEIKKIRAVFPPWVLFINVSGYERYPEKEAEWKEEQIKNASLEQGLELKGALDGVSAAGLLMSLEKVPEKDRRLRFKDSCQILPFMTTLDRTPELATTITRTAADYGYPSTDISIYIQPVIQGCMCECEVIYPYNIQNKQEVQKVKSLFISTAQQLSHKGAYYSRPYGVLADITYKDTELANVLRKMKGILDPNDIMNTGKLY
jgi:FAD/FMN-containing dehydrogenase